MTRQANPLFKEAPLNQLNGGSIEIRNIFNDQNTLRQIAWKHDNSTSKPLLATKDYPHGQTNQETPKLPYLRQPSGPQSVFYQKGKVKLYIYMDLFFLMVCSYHRMRKEERAAFLREANKSDIWHLTLESSTKSPQHLHKEAVCIL